MKLVNLEGTLDKTINTFSGGMKRRLSLAITLLSNPDLIILDEPTVGIDPKLRQQIWSQLKSLTQQREKCHRHNTLWTKLNVATKLG